MVQRVPRFSILIAVVAVAAAFAPAGGAWPNATVNPTLYVEYTINCTFTIVDDDGRRLTSIAPGTYQVHVGTPLVFSEVDLSGIHDFTACKGFVQFELAGPGVDLFTTLQDGDDDDDDLKATFLPSSTYTARDLNQPSVARVVFTTSASGSPTAPPSPYQPSPASAAGKTSPSVDIVGSAAKANANPFRGTLAAKVSSAGKLTLTFKGKAVDKLKSGRYKIAVLDQSKKAGFNIQQFNKAVIALTTSTFAGKRAKTLTMKPGQWLYFQGTREPNYFVVVGGN